jgi:chromosome segregation ATPase
MNIDAIPDRLKELIDHARAALDQQIAKARKAVDDLNLEKTAAANALTELQDQHKKAKADLESVLADLHRASSLGSIRAEIKKAQKALAALNIEKEKASTALAALAKERTGLEARVDTLNNEVRRLLAIRSESQATMADIKMKLQQVQIGHRP